MFKRKSSFFRCACIYSRYCSHSGVLQTRAVAADSGLPQVAGLQTQRQVRTVHTLLPHFPRLSEQILK